MHACKIAGVLSVLAALVLTAPAKAQTPVTFQLNWTAGGPIAGFAAALGEGYYKDVGLDVTLVQGNGSGNTAQLVASGQAQIAFAEAVAVSQLIAKGAPMKIVATVYQTNSAEVNALEGAGISSIKDLIGKRVGVPAGSAQAPMLPLFFEANGIKETDIQLLNMPPTAMAPALLQGQVDAILGSSDSYRVQVEMQGKKVVYYPFYEYGVPTISTSIFASNDYIAQNPDVLRRFVAASLKGWAFAMDNQPRTIEHLKAIFPDLNVRYATAELANIPPLFCSGGARFVGKSEPAHWEQSVQLLSQVGLLPKDKAATAYYTNEYLPADAELRPCTP